MKIFLVRHAHADWTSDEMRPLSTTGQRDAYFLAETLVKHPVHRIVSSPYLRAIQTVQPLADRLGLEIHIDDRFRERALGQFSGVSFAEAVWLTWQDFDFHYPGGESNAAAQDRGVQAMQDLRLQGAEQIVVGTHGNLLALIMNYYDPAVDYEYWAKLSMPDFKVLELKR